jgi:hypothetical protein
MEPTSPAALLISIPEFSRRKAKTFQGLRTHQFKSPIRQFSNLSDLQYVPTLETFLSYKHSWLLSYGSSLLWFDLPKKQYENFLGKTFQGKLSRETLSRQHFPGNTFQGHLSRETLMELTVVFAPFMLLVVQTATQVLHEV